MITLLFPGIPFAEKRHCHNGNTGHVYNPNKIDQRRVAWEAKAQYRGPLLLGPVIVSMTFRLPMLKGFSKAELEAANSGSIYPITGKDGDNMEKFYFDAFNKVIWWDDAQVVRVKKDKIYSYEPAAIFTIEEIQNGQKRKVT